MSAATLVINWEIVFMFFAERKATLHIVCGFATSRVMVAGGGIEPPTRGFSRRKSKTPR